ncbi:MAG: FAD-dependent oxidoreductase [Acidobacteria bacterium]|nr:FAD-dependent oxidoreductase [Acidobacteriota bacterium]
MSLPVASYLETNFPCRAACPVNTNAGGYVSLIAQGRYREAYLLARAPNPLASVCGRVCAHPCEAACRRGQIDAPIAIRAMKRVVTERCGVESQASFEEIAGVVERPRPPAARARRVAIVGAGPAGLACAHDLALMGHRAVIFDAAPVVGGMMRLGIPAYRLPRELVDREVEFIRYLGVEFRLGVEIGRDITFRQLRDEFDAVFVAAGCRKGKMLKLPGADTPGVLTAVDFLANVNLGAPLEVGRRVVVVGGGNVAFDVARSARRFGGTTQPDEEHHHLAMDAAIAAARLLRREVTLVSLESREEMPADPEEIEEGSHEGIRLIHRRGPKAVLGDGRVRALQTIDVARVFDERGRFAPEFVPGSEQEIPCDTVILAIGQIADLSFLGDTPDLIVTPQQTIVVDAHLATSLPGVYAGGDIAFGPRILISAIADGRKAARSIDTFLTGRVDPPPSYAVRVFPTFGYDHPFARGDYELIPRRRVPVLPIERRQAREEVELPLSAAEARAEGSRCLHCWVNTIFDSSAVRGSECIQCGGCADVCPEQCIELISVVRIAEATTEALALLPNGAPAAFLEAPNGALLLKDETACIRCGLCARRCPTACITMQAFYRADEAAVMQMADVVM